MKLLSALLLSVTICGIADGSKILAIFPMPSKSHYILGEALLRGLAKKGHEVTMISPYSIDKPMKNYSDVVINGMLEVKEQYGGGFANFNATFLEKMGIMYELFPAVYDISHNNSNVQEFLQKGEKFDVCIVSFLIAESMYGLCHAVQAPAIGFSTVGMASFISYHTNNPVPYSYVPTPFMSFTDQMSFIERVKNTMTWILIDGIIKYISLPYQNTLIQKYYPNAPSINELMDDVDLILMNSHISTDTPKPLLPNVIPIGGYHLQIMDDIPKDILKFLDESKKGVIYFNMGSNMKSSDLEPAIQEAILNSFAKVDYDVLWKFEMDLPKKPKNVHIAKWLPQRPILMHPKVKMFMTHGGLGGTVESIYGGVPMICMPLFGDQGKNCAQSVTNGYAVLLEVIGLTEEKLLAAIKELEINPSYKEKVMLKSDLYRNQEINPMEKAIFWVEHVIRHKGAKHLKSRAASIPWCQYYLLDVIALLVLIMLIVLGLAYYIIRINLKVLCWMIMKVTGKEKCCKKGQITKNKKQKVKKQ